MIDAPTLTAERLDKLAISLRGFPGDGPDAAPMGLRADEARALVALARSALNAPGREEASQDRIWRLEPTADPPTLADSQREIELAYKEARGLAEYLWRERYAASAPNWKPLETLRGVLGQLDNMLAGLAPTPNRDKLRENVALKWLEWSNWNKDFLDWAATAGREILEWTKHEGDCTKKPWTCLACQGEEAFRFADSLLALLPDRGGGVCSGVYVASRASVLERGTMWRRYRDAGAPIISTWIDEDGPNDTADLDELWVRIRREVITAERLILYVESSDFPLKGAFVEIGLALGANVPIFIVAPGVEITGRNQRPFGSWIKHPLVRFAATVDEALAAVPTSQEGV